MIPYLSSEVYTIHFVLIATMGRISGLYPSMKSPIDELCWFALQNSQPAVVLWNRSMEEVLVTETQTWLLMMRLCLLAAKTMTRHSYSLSYLQVAREEGVYTLLGQGVEVCPCWEGASEVLCQCFFAIFLQKLFSNKTINKVATSKDSYSQ